MNHNMESQPIRLTENAVHDNASATVKIIHLGELDEDHSVGSQPVVDTINPLHQIKARLQVCVGEAFMTVGDLLNAKEHQIVTLDRKVEQPIDLMLEGKVIARGQLVAAGEYFAIRITELPMPLKA